VDDLEAEKQLLRDDFEAWMGKRSSAAVARWHRRLIVGGPAVTFKLEKGDKTML
jgi:hypothetical protein